MGSWEELQSRLLSQFSNASSIVQRLQVIHKSRNYGGLKCVEGIEGAVLAKQMKSLQTILLSMNKTMQLVKGGSAQLTTKQLKQQIGVKPSVADCLDGLSLLEEMHQSEYHLKLSVVSALPELALKLSGGDGDLDALRQLLVDQPNIPREEVQLIFDMVFAEEIC